MNGDISRYPIEQLVPIDSNLDEVDLESQLHPLLGLAPLSTGKKAATSFFRIMKDIIKAMRPERINSATDDQIRALFRQHGHLIEGGGGAFTGIRNDGLIDWSSDTSGGGHDLTEKGLEIIKLMAKEYKMK